MYVQDSDRMATIANKKHEQILMTLEREICRVMTKHNLRCLPC